MEESPAPLTPGEERWIGGEPWEQVGPWAALWRDRGLLVIALAALALVAVIAVTALSPGRDLLREVKLKSERGATVLKDVPSLAHGERFRLDLRLRKPCSILVFVEDPEGGFSQVYPAAGEAGLIAGPWTRLPPDGDAWEAGGIDAGSYCLWVFAAPRPFSAGECESIRDRLKASDPRDRRRGRPPLKEFQLPAGVEAVGRPFVVMD